MKIPYVDLSLQHRDLKNEILKAVEGVLDSGEFILGAETKKFEAEFAALCSTSQAVGLNSGTDALILAFRALGIGPGDEVITAPNSYLASASSIALAGATVRFADIREDFNLDPLAIERTVTSKTKAIAVVHLTGRPAPMDEILNIARRRGLRVVEDAAQAVGAKYRDRPVGSLGDIGCFSLHPLKNLNACGDGGMMVTNDPVLADRVRLLRNHGHPNRDDCVDFSIVSRLDSIQAAILRVKLPWLERITQRRRENANWYREALAGCMGVRCPQDRPEEFSVYHTFMIECDRRDELRAHLESKGIGSAIHYPVPIHLMQVGRKLGFKAGMFPVAERLAKRILSLPIYPQIDRNQVVAISKEITSFYG
jgi:dTDP-4-amino-4,6-dideoxygalactose transaminase